MDKKRIGVIGCGQWGKNHIRNFHFNSSTQVVRICDAEEARLQYIKSIYKDIEITKNKTEIIAAKDIDAIIVCTPTHTHFEITKEALLNGKDVLCEKPITRTAKECEELIKIAKKNKLVLMVGHVFLFNPGIIKLKELIQKKECGDIHYLYSKRTNLGPIRNDVNVVHDLASHDIYIFNYLLDSTPKVLSATGKCLLRPNIEDIAFISLEYPENTFVHLHVSWLDPRKLREITAVGNKKMITWNDLMERPLEIYSKHVEQDPFYMDYGEFRLLAKEGEILIPEIKNAEPLKLQTEHFIECIINRKEPIANVHNGLEVVKTLEEINKKMTIETLK